MFWGGGAMKGAVEHLDQQVFFGQTFVTVIKGLLQPGKEAFLLSSIQHAHA